MIHEANYKVGYDSNIVGYDTENYILDSNNNIVHTIMLIRKGISYKRRYDLEEKLISTIWVQILISKKVSKLICVYYGQWSLPTNMGI